MDIAAWLRDLDLEIYAPAFRDNDVDLEILKTLSADDLKELGISSLGHRKKLLRAAADLADGPATRPSPPPPQEAERRQLTVLFCDLLGSTELSARLDPEDLGELIAAYRACCGEVVRRWDGYVARYLGDGTLAYFGWPRAHEDGAERAVRAGLELTRAIEALRPKEGVSLRARVGIATGQVVVGELLGAGSARDEVMGETPNLAARLQALAAPGTVVIGPTTRRLVRGLFALEDLGSRCLKGFVEPVLVWRAIGESRTESRFEALRGRKLTPFVGRRHELRLLLEHWTLAAGGEGQVVLLAGEPGIGKSRLIWALRKRLGERAYTPLTHYCSPHHVNSALYPVIGLLERAAGFAREDTPDVRVAKLETVLSRGTGRLEEAGPLVAALLSIPTGERYPALNLTPQRQKQRTFEVLLEQLEGLARQQPVLALYEDLHWVDPSTLELVGMAIDRVPRLPVLMVLTYRPEFAPPWTGQAHVTLLPLGRLDRAEGATMALRVTGDKQLPPEITEEIVERTDGVPLFVEELTKTVLDSGLLRDAGDRYELSGPLPPLTIPETLHDSLMARLDRLAHVKEIAQLGAVIGREFSGELIGAVAARPGKEIGHALDELARSELVFRRDAAAETVYVFKHTMIQDVAYRSLLKSRRRGLHARIARVLEERFPGTVAAEPELLAQHYTAARLHAQAVDYWHRAGRRATERSADLEAIAHLTKGLELARKLANPMHSARQELKLQVALGEALVAAKGFGAPEVGATYTRALELCRQIDDPRHLFPTMWGLSQYYRGQGALQRARHLGHDLLGLAERYGDPMLLVAVHQGLGHSLYHLGEFPAALSHLEQARAGFDIKLERSLQLRYGVAPKVQCLASLAQVLWCLGYPDQALQRSCEAVGAARELSHLHSLACSMYFAIRLRLLRGEPQEADELAEPALALSNKHGFTFWAALILFMQGWSLCQQGRGADGVVRMRVGFVSAQATGAKMMRPMFCALLGQAYGQAGEIDEGERMLSDAGDAVEESSQRQYEAEMHRFKGELHLRAASPDVQQAGLCFERALRIARQQEAKSWELRAAMSLARLWRDQGRRTEARELLAPVYGWFTEGFDTADLKDAKALLDQL